VSLIAQREVIGERTRDAMQHSKAQGQVSSRPVFEDTATLAWMQAERLAGCSYEGIAERLSAAGTPTTRGGRWQGNMVRRSHTGLRAAHGVLRQQPESSEDVEAP
jgi:DNA invertase Pin-like site-specific DNA recombinase